MIYLLDDNKNDKRKSSFDVSFVDDGTFNGYLTPVSRLPKNADLDHFLKAKCILVHTTTEDVDHQGKFISQSTTNVTRIIEDVANNGDRIPLVTFSNQMTGPVVYDYDINPFWVKSIHKTLLYQQRLHPFLKHYKDTGQIELKIIAYGENFKAIEAGRYAKYLIESLALYDRKEKVSLSFFSRLTMLERFFEFMLPDGNYNEFVNDLEDHPITVDKFVENVSLIIESISENYGKNTHTWQS